MAAARAEHRALADEIRDLTDEQWASPSLCGAWSVEDVVAHLTAGVTTGTVGWIRSVVGARFDFDLHNERLLAANRGPDSASTLARYRCSEEMAKPMWGPKAAWLGEVVVHGNDIRRAVGIPCATPVETLTPVAHFFARTNFTVASKTAVRDLRVEATDGRFGTGSGPLVSGPTLSLVMAMAGRVVFCDDLTGPGVDVLRTQAAS